MSGPGSMASVPAHAADFAELWAEATAKVLEQLGGSAFTAAPVDAAESWEPATGTIAIVCKAAGRVAGSFLIEVEPSSAVRMAQLLMAEPMNASVELTEGYKDALGEVFRQFGGLAATAAKSKYGAAVEFELALGEMPAWTPAATVRWTFSAPSAEAIAWRMRISAEMGASIESARSSAAQSASSAAPSAAPAAPPATAASEAHAGGAIPENLGLLLDVTLDAHLRFGQRQMLLREILDLRAGSVVELDRRLQEPAELLVSGRVVARGEVVIVDGSYGIRITDIVHPQQRLMSVKA
jgi:flagellar motor switch protein FliN